MLKAVYGSQKFFRQVLAHDIPRYGTGIVIATSVSIGCMFEVVDATCEMNMIKSTER